MDGFQSLSRARKLGALACAVAVCMVLVLAFADDSDYKAALAARRQKLSDDLKFDGARDFFGEESRDWNKNEVFEPAADADAGIATSNFHNYGETDYSDDMEHKLQHHISEVHDAYNTNGTLNGNLAKANEKLDMPGIISFP